MQHSMDMRANINNFPVQAHQRSLKQPVTEFGEKQDFKGTQPLPLNMLELTAELGKFNLLDNLQGNFGLRSKERLGTIEESKRSDMPEELS